LFRSGLRQLINSQPDMEVVAESDSWDSLGGVIAAHHPKVATVDLSMPGGNPIARLRKLKRDHPELRVVVVTMHPEPVYVRAAIAAGAEGYVIKSAAEDELMEAIRQATAGKLYSSIAMAGPEADSTPSPDSTLAESSSIDPTTLSARELQVLEAAARGLTNREIAEQLHLSVKTVESYRSRLMLKLNIKSRAELVDYAVKHRLVWWTSPGQAEHDPGIASTL